jgi:hypothetical protein
MRIQFKMEGGIASFPGLSKPITIDSDQLPQQESDELKRLVNATHFFNLPAVIGSPAPGSADYFLYTITMQDDGKQHTVRLTDPIEDPNLRALLTYFRTRRPTLG